MSFSGLRTNWSSTHTKSKVRSVDRLEHREDVLLLLGFVLFFTEGAVTNAVSAVVGPFGQTIVNVVVAVIIFAPLTAAILSKAARGARIHVGAFPILYVALIFGFMTTLLVHPEYEAIMFAPEWPHHIGTFVLSPTSAIFAYLVVSLVEKPSLLFNALVAFAYVNFLYGSLRFINFQLTGYWTGYSFTGAEERLTYSLGFGYDVLAVYLVLLILAFRRNRPLVHGLLAFMALAMIAIAGGRAALLLAVVGSATVIFYYGARGTRKSPWAVLGLILTGVSAIVLVLAFEAVLETVTGVLNSLGIDSRSVDSLTSGEFQDDNGRAKIYEMAQDLIANGGLLGHGLYGDRYAISGRFFWGYPHNIVYELIISFGPLVGVILMLSFLFWIVRGFWTAATPEFQEVILVCFVMSLQLMISNSYLLLPWFWALLAASRLSIKNRQQIRSPEEDSTRTGSAVV